MPDLGIGEIAALVVAVAAVASTTYTLTKGTPGVPELPKPSRAADAPPVTPPPPAAPVTQLAEGDQQARQRAAMRQRELQRRQSNASTVLTSPLGASSAPTPKASVLGG